jgi:hypothetical protein
MMVHPPPLLQPPQPDKQQHRRHPRHVDVVTQEEALVAGIVAGDYGASQDAVLSGTMMMMTMMMALAMDVTALPAAALTGKTISLQY